MSDSVGGNLAALVALAFRDAAIPVAAQLLVYPCVDLAREPEYPSLAENAHGYILTASDLDACLKAYINDDPAVAKQFTPSPLRAADHRGLAPAVIGQGQRRPARPDPGLRGRPPGRRGDGALQHAERIRNSGSPALVDRPLDKALAKATATS
ncbi:alpha/beta hydrolase fold domain-containing protein [Streptomyces sp. SID8014]|uniref:alpha/beta hydrolase fold domain-containing protein n=1 Tax=Streptomyces sp. SID8014 TaxID=2706097 RepID=UPI0023B2D286|nr:alpha/beta hydrolase fold domain-containing protein [Streptomyces sp. SID8014]